MLTKFENRQINIKDLSRLCSAILMISAMSLTGCQPKNEAGGADNSQTETEGNPAEKSKNAATDSGANALENGVAVESPMSETTAEHVASLEADFVTKMLERQKLDIEAYAAHQAELEKEKQAAENAADATATEKKSTENNSTEDNSTKNASTQNDSTKKGSNSNKAKNNDSKSDDSSDSSSSNNSTSKNSNDSETDLSEEELAELKAFEERPLANVVFPITKELTATDFSNRYRIALQSLYLPDEVPLATQAVNTLLNIALITPSVFDDPELADRLIVKMPALARMISNYQRWERHKAEQLQELEKNKQAQIEAQEEQTAKFDALVKEFDSKIKDYDEQIAKYEKKLKKFE